MNKELGYRIRKIREFRNYTQAYIADRLHIRQNTYSRIENGIIEISKERLHQIALILDIATSDILNTGADIFSIKNETQENTIKLLKKMADDIEYLKQQNRLLLAANSQRSFR